MRLLLLLLALGGCDTFAGDTAGVAVNVQGDRVAPGEDLVAVLDNDSRHAVAYSCPQLVRAEGGTFVSAVPEMICASILVRVGASGTVPLHVRVPETAPAGTYAVRVEVGREQPDEAVMSRPFSVGPR